MAVLTVDINHLEIDHFDVLFADHRHNILYGFGHRRASFLYRPAHEF